MNALTELRHEFEAAGFTLIRRRKHAIWRCPCGKHQLACHSSPGGGRGDNNCRARIRRTLRQCQAEAK